MFDFNILSIIAGIPGLLIAMVIHEYAHAQVADWMGDDTPRLMGRLTLNPVAHIDPVGLIMLLVAQFGWPSRLRSKSAISGTGGKGKSVYPWLVPCPT